MGGANGLLFQHCFETVGACRYEREFADEYEASERCNARLAAARNRLLLELL